MFFFKKKNYGKIERDHEVASEVITLVSLNESYIWPRLDAPLLPFCLLVFTFSSLLPCEYSNVIDADGSLIYTTTKSFPLFILNLNMSTLCLISTPVILSFFTPPPPSLFLHPIRRWVWREERELRQHRWHHRPHISIYQFQKSKSNLYNLYTVHTYTNINCGI